jgi:hypothetical protein
MAPAWGVRHGRTLVFDWRVVTQPYQGFSVFVNAPKSLLRLRFLAILRIKENISEIQVKAENFN